jgi:hypothetical protein
LWGFVKEAVYVRPPLTTLVDLKIISQLRWTQWRKTSFFGYGMSSATVLMLSVGPEGAHWTSIDFIVSIIKYTLHNICH